MTMRLLAIAVDDELTIRCYGQLDLAARCALPEACQRWQVGRYDQVTVDLSEVDFCDCAGLSGLIATHHMITDAGSSPVIVGAGSPLRRLIGTARCDWLFSARDPHMELSVA